MFYPFKRANPFFFEILLKNIFSFLIFLLKPKSIGENYDHNFHYWLNELLTYFWYWLTNDFALKVYPAIKYPSWSTGCFWISENPILGSQYLYYTYLNLFLFIFEKSKEEENFFVQNNNIFSKLSFQRTFLIPWKIRYIVQYSWFEKYFNFL